jgi:hypothetical protein
MSYVAGASGVLDEGTTIGAPWRHDHNPSSPKRLCCAECYRILDRLVSISSHGVRARVVPRRIRSAGNYSAFPMEPVHSCAGGADERGRAHAASRSLDCRRAARGMIEESRCRKPHCLARPRGEARLCPAPLEVNLPEPKRVQDAMTYGDPHDRPGSGGQHGLRHSALCKT